MLTGIRSSVVAKSVPSAERMEQFTSESARRLTVTELGDGTVNIECVTCLQAGPDFTDEIRQLAKTEKDALEHLASMS